MWMTTCLTSRSDPLRGPSAAARARAGGRMEEASTPPAPAAAELSRRRRVTSGMTRTPFEDGRHDSGPRHLHVNRGADASLLDLWQAYVAVSAAVLLRCGEHVTEE